MTVVPSGVHAEEPSALERPTLLVIGRSDSFQEALVERLSQRALNVETARPERAVEATVVTAPDLIVLGPGLGEKGLLEQLVSSAVSSVIPIVLLQDEEPLDARLRAFRRGAAAVVARTASVDALAERLATLAREIPERDGDVGSEVVPALSGSAGEATLEEFVRMLASELRSGILSVESGVVNAPVRLVLGAGRPLLSAVDEFVARISQHVLHAEPLRYEFDDRAGGTLAVWDEVPSRGRLGRGDVSGLRLMLCDDDPARIDQVAQQLRERGAHVAVCSLSPDALELADLRQFDPEVVVMSEVAIAGAGYALLRRMKQDLRLRWASLLVVRWEQIFELDRTVPGFDRLTAMLADLAEVDRGMSDRAELGDAFDARLEVNGPARCLRALARTGRPLSLSIQHARAELRVELSRGLVVSAWARSRQDSSTWEGALALSVMLGLRTGRVHVAPIEQPTVANLMAEVDLALDWAERETSPLAPSRPSSDALSVSGARAAVVASPNSGPATPLAAQAATTVASATSWPARESAVSKPAQAVQIARTLPVGPAPEPSPRPPVLSPEPAVSPVAANEPATNPDSAFAPEATSVIPASPSAPDEPKAGTGDSSGVLARAWATKPIAATLNSIDSALKALSLSKQARFSRLTREWVVFLLGLAALQGLVVAYALKLLLHGNASEPQPRASASLPDKPEHAPKESARALEPARKPAPGRERTKLAAPPSSDSASAATGGPASAMSAAPAGRAEVTSTERSDAPSRKSSSENAGIAPTPDADLSVEPASASPLPAGCELAGGGVTAGGAMTFTGPNASVEALKAARKALMQGELESAQRAYCQALALDQQNSRLHFELAQLMLIRSQPEQAVAWAKRGVKLEPANPRGLELIGDGLARLGDAAGARHAWFAAADLENPSPAQIERLSQEALREATAAARQRDPSRAERFFTRVTLLTPGNAAAELGLARALLKLGEKRLAVPHARRAVELSPKEPRAQMVLGEALLAQGNREGAREAFQAAERLGLPEARRRLAKLDKE